MTQAFVSYSWDSKEHKAWVRDLAEQLHSGGITTTLDQWSTVPGDSLPFFMEKAIRENPFVIIVCTPQYKRKSDERLGGTGYEGDIITGEVFTGKSRRKFIPVLRSGQWTEAAPSWLLGSYFVDLRGEEWTNNLPLLVDTLHGRQVDPPPVQVQGFVVLERGDVLDSGRGLVWTNCRNTELFAYEQVLPILEKTMRTTGYKWRLPSTEEIAQLTSAEEYYPRPPIMVVVEGRHPLLGTFKKSAWTPTIQSNVKRADAARTHKGTFDANQALRAFSGIAQMLGVEAGQLASEAEDLRRKFPIRFVRESNEEDRKSVVKQQLL